MATASPARTGDTSIWKETSKKLALIAMNVKLSTSGISHPSSECFRILALSCFFPVTHRRKSKADEAGRDIADIFMAMEGKSPLRRGARTNRIIKLVKTAKLPRNPSTPLENRFLLYRLEGKAAVNASR
jgi:hypothetical protein